ncbi:MAG TPA: GNAT family N-acetyltransferase [Steroidobacteraceae bacterium]|jgi:GNAT superfamily N-acetyltransferase|nr:GNAT family N-acetyltransferase [Steroidobacteraceae bacterium]
MTEPSLIQPARFPRDLEIVRTLFREYAASLNFDLCFQGFEEELAGLPGKYAAPAGAVFLAMKNGEPMGCVALRPIGNGDCEMKRLFVRPAARGEKLGRRLAERVCRQAVDAGYSRICLDTVESMREARALYESLGFREIEPYVFNPLPEAKYMARELRSDRHAVKDLGRHDQP